jgi:hypothetical protein
MLTANDNENVQQVFLVSTGVKISSKKTLSLLFGHYYVPVFGYTSE